MFNDLGSLLPQAIKRAGINKQVSTANAIKVAEAVVQDKVPAEAAEELKPAYIQNGQLAVAALSSLAAQELQFREDEVIKAVNHKLGSETVKRIKYLT